MVNRIVALTSPPFRLGTSTYYSIIHSTRCQEAAEEWKEKKKKVLLMQLFIALKRFINKRLSGSNHDMRTKNFVALWALLSRPQGSLPSARTSSSLSLFVLLFTFSSTACFESSFFFLRDRPEWCKVSSPLYYSVYSDFLRCSFRGCRRFTSKSHKF